jgi:hypothetical protein
MVSGRWLTLAAGVVLAAGVITAILINKPPAGDDALARDAIGDHRNCALKYRLVRMPMPLEEAARRFDTAYRLLLTAPPDDVATPNGPAHVVERHSCAYGGRRFGHVILHYRGRVVSLLITANNGTTGSATRPALTPHAVGRPVDGLSAVSVNGSRHAVMVVSDLANDELTQLSQMLSLPLVERLGSDNASTRTTFLTASNSLGSDSRRTISDQCVTERRVTPASHPSSGTTDQQQTKLSTFSVKRRLRFGRYRPIVVHEGGETDRPHPTHHDCLIAKGTGQSRLRSHRLRPGCGGGMGFVGPGPGGWGAGLGTGSGFGLGGCGCGTGTASSVDS